MTIPSRIPRILVLLALAAFGSPTFAVEFVLLKNGDRVTGDVKRIWNGDVFVEPAYGDEYAIDLDYVEYVQTDENMEVDVRIGRRIEKVIGRLGITESGDSGVIADTGELLYPLVLVDNMQEIEDFFDWEVRSDLSVNVSEGNTETSSSRLGIYGSVTLGNHHYELNASRDEQRTDNELTKDQTQISLQDTWTFTDKFFVRGSLSWNSDPIRQLERRTRIFVGPGYHFFDDSKRTLNTSIGPEWVDENIGGEIDSSAAIKVTLDYEQHFREDDLVAFSNTSYTRIFEGRRNRLYSLTAGFRYDITDDIYANLQGTYDYESNPAVDQGNEDITYLIGIGIELD